MNLQTRIELAVELGKYMQGNDENWVAVKEKAFQHNGWFIAEFIELSVNNIAKNYLQKEQLETFCQKYNIANESSNKIVGIVMAGNIPLVGFHDFLCVFLSGHRQLIKISEKDNILLPHLVSYLAKLNNEVNELVQFSTMLKDCDAYIATGSNNTARYFHQYFDKYKNIIRGNKTSIAVLTGVETEEELILLANDIHFYFGLGCRNVTKIWVPKDYNFIPLLTALRKYDYFKDHNKYKNNYDYNLAIHILNKVYYMTNESIILVEDKRNFSPISQLNYELYSNEKELEDAFKNNNELQCIVGKNYIPFGEAQNPNINQFADGVDTMQFLTKI